MADCHNIFNPGLGYGQPGCNNDHPLGPNCCTTPFGPSFPDLSTGPIANFAPYSKNQKTQMMRTMFRSGGKIMSAQAKETPVSSRMAI
uniref:Uncharacterized protein n=1 Tax=viral metagenome TaxID=1070528 RepID=A0A6C0EK18_9ZZZZ